MVAKLAKFKVEKNKEALILANGAFPKNANLINKLKTSEYLICCDGAVNNLEKIGIKPQIIIGDLDSINSDIKERYKDIIYHISEQDNNDLTKAVNWTVNQGFKRITILGATGKREDHTIGNIFLLLRYIHKVQVQMISDYGILTPITGDTVFESFKGQQVSMFAPDNSTKILTHNLRYPLDNRSLPELWNGTLNEVLADSFEIKLPKGGKLIVYQAF